ncbi:hypothetical protein NP233_g12873 [Leucocoprinus birnbaumii]|uniref:Uncharacterized protein n=1 Tax=Leucocoprinus birnbaumii TaxID=56174 RepID=A0AAD5VE29_9AGAR|nr:hypothetical protein NP233_g12873 [Leucocoprinus birnbaumii]
MVYEVPSVNGEMNLYRNPDLINDTGFPTEFQMMYDPSSNAFVGMHHQSGTFQVDQRIPFWVMKKGNLDIDVCPGINPLCDVVELGWNGVRDIFADNARSPPRMPPTSSPVSFTDPSSPTTSTLFPLPLPRPFVTPTPPPLNQLAFDYLGNNRLGSIPSSASPELLGKRKRETTPVPIGPIGPIGPINISIYVKGQEIQVDQEMIDVSTNPVDTAVPAVAPSQATEVSNQAVNNTDTQPKLYQTAGVQAGSEIIDLTISEDEGSGEPGTIPQSPVKRVLRSRNGKGKARRGRRS